MLFLRTCMGRKWMWFWPLASKQQQKSRYENTCFDSYFADEVYRLCKAHVILFIRCHEMRWHCFFTVNSSVNAARSYWTNFLAEVPWLTPQVKEFSLEWCNQPSWCSGKVKSHRAEGSRVQVVLCTVLFYLLSFFFSRFWHVLFAYLFCCFSINMYLNDRYLIIYRFSQG